MALVCAGTMVPTKIITGLDPVVTAAEFLQEDVADPEEPIDHAFERMSQPGHVWQSREYGQYVFKEDHQKESLIYC